LLREQCCLSNRYVPQTPIGQTITLQSQTPINPHTVLLAVPDLGAAMAATFSREVKL
jgi:hypothetical protein